MNLLFQLSLLHRYFTSGVFETCQVVADQQTNLFLQRHDLLVRTDIANVSVYSTSTQADFSAYLQQRLDGAALRFLLINDASQFVQITDLSFDYVGQLGFSTKNRQSETSGPSGVRQFQLIPVPGADQVNQLNVIGVVAVYLDDCVSSGGQGTHYRINFQPRVLHWLYYVINRSQQKLHQPVICNQQKIKFEEPVPVQLATGEDALCFSSGSLQFQLQQSPTTLFDLVDNIPSALHTNEQPTVHCLIKGLPTPHGENLKAKQVGNSSYAYGEMYVYL